MRKCEMCGKVLPEGSAPSRRFCDECSRERNRYRQRNRNRSRSESKPKEYISLKNNISAADRAYCDKCIFHNGHSQSYLCNYIMMTGMMRGCKAGVGCTKKKVAKPKGKAEGKKVCERCGAIFESSGQAKYCLDCRKEAFRRNAQKLNVKGLKKS